MIKKNITIQYYSLLREKVGTSLEQIVTTSENPKEVFEELQRKYQLDYSYVIFKPVINDEFSEWGKKIKEGDSVVFIPPISGG